MWKGASDRADIAPAAIARKIRRQPSRTITCSASLSTYDAGELVFKRTLESRDCTDLAQMRQASVQVNAHKF